MAASIHLSSLPKAPPPRLARRTTFETPRRAFRTVVHIVASYAASKTSDANGLQRAERMPVYATGRAEEKPCDTNGRLSPPASATSTSHCSPMLNLPASGPIPAQPASPDVLALVQARHQQHHLWQMEGQVGRTVGARRLKEWKTRLLS
jgi:hypothetical protein